MYLAPGDRYACDYYPGVSIHYTATPSPGWRFDHWEVNGQKVKAASVDPDGTAALTADGTLLQDGTCTVRAVAVPVEGERLVIAEVSAAGRQDWIRLCNAGTTPVNLGRYCISDTPDNLRLFRLPRETLLPGESVRINGSGCEAADAGKALCTCNFGLHRDETLYLTPDDGLDLAADALRIPRMSVNCSYGRRDDGGIFAWFDNREN